MKTTKYFIMTVILLFSFTGCKNDDEEPQLPIPEGDVSVQLKLLDAVMTTTYAAGTDIEPPIGGESDLASNLEVFVFDSLENFEYYKQVGNNSGVTDPFKISAGPKYFYVFSNFPGNLPVPGPNTKRENFEKNIRTTILSNNNTDISQNSNFFIGTLWQDTIRVKGIGTTASPEPITVPVGRIVAKVMLTGAPSKAGGSNLKGDFDSVYYRVKSIPSDFYIVGQYTGGLDEQPPKKLGIPVISAVHTEDNFSTKFTDYVFPDSTTTPTNVGINGIPYYIIENTTQPDANGKLYFANTTYIQVKLKYKPDITTEVYNGSTGQPEARLDDSGDFYVGTYNGSRLIFNEDPTPTGATDIVYYQKGLNYYNIPIKDISEDTLTLQARVLRNHYYDIAIKSISRLGENTPDVPPTTPIIEDRDIELNITVLPWSKIKYEPEI